MAWLSGDRLLSCCVVAIVDAMWRLFSPFWDRLPNDDLQLSVFVCTPLSVDIGSGGDDDDNVDDVVVVIVDVIEADISFGCVVLWLISGFIRADVYMSEQRKKERGKGSKSNKNICYYCDSICAFHILYTHTKLTRSSVGFSRYLFTISLTLHRCSSNSVFANDGAQLIILHRHSMDSFSNLSTSSTDKHSKTKLSGSVFKALWCSMSISSVPIVLSTIYSIITIQIAFHTEIHITCIIIIIVFALIIWRIFHIWTVWHLGNV